MDKDKDRISHFETCTKQGLIAAKVSFVKEAAPTICPLKRVSFKGREVLILMQVITGARFVQKHDK
jgi:hypothetical protein